MLLRSAERLIPKSIPRDLVLLSLISGLSGMALNGAAIFGLLAVLSGSYFLYGLTGVGVYIVVGASSTFMGYAAVCRYGAVLGLKYRMALYAVFIVHALGFLAAAVIHPAFVALSAGLGLGMFSAVFMLKNIHDIEDSARDGYATFNGLIQQGMILTAPVLGSVVLYLATRAGFHDPFFPTFLTFSCCVLVAIPLIRRMSDKPLPCNIHLPLMEIFEKRHALAIGLFLSTIFCECLMNPSFIILSFALLGKAVQVGWMEVFITLLAGTSLLFSHRVRLPGRRWAIMSGSIIGIGLAFALVDASFRLQTLLLAGAVYAILRVNYMATWFAMSSRVMEYEWGHFGKNQALVLGEIFVLSARICAATLLLGCGLSGISLRQSLVTITGCFLVSAFASMLFAKILDQKGEA